MQPEGGLSHAQLESLFNCLDEHNPILIRVTLVLAVSKLPIMKLNNQKRDNNTMHLNENTSKLININSYNINKMHI